MNWAQNLWKTSGKPVDSLKVHGTASLNFSMKKNKSTHLVPQGLGQPQWITKLACIANPTWPPMAPPMAPPARSATPFMPSHAPRQRKQPATNVFTKSSVHISQPGIPTLLGIARIGKQSLAKTVQPNPSPLDKLMEKTNMEQRKPCLNCHEFLYRREATEFPPNKIFPVLFLVPEDPAFFVNQASQCSSNGRLSNHQISVFMQPWFLPIQVIFPTPEHLDILAEFHHDSTYSTSLDFPEIAGNFPFFELPLG